MKGAIVGDILGSIFEQIPKHPVRVVMQATDDSILTCACHEWVNSIKNPKELLKTLEGQNKLYEKAVRSLKKWAKLFPENSGFSKGFTDWAATSGYKSKVADTNGCIMRSSPISRFSFKHQLTTEERHALLTIFCKTTHDHVSSYEACIKHSNLIMFAFTHCLDETNNYIALNHKNELKKAQEWQEKAKDLPGKFIWSAKDSLAIAIGSIYYSNSWEEMMNYFKTIGGDVDTYAAIAGPIGELLYKDFPQAYETALNVILDSTRYNDIHILKIINSY